jgi:hypothetical protein
LAEQINKVVFVLAEFGPKIAKIDAKHFHGKRRVRGREARFGCPPEPWQTILEPSS